MTCPKTIKTACFNFLSKQYYSYLAYENSICGDYMTEKVYHPMKYDSIPIVLAGANLTRFLPPDSYIDAILYTEEQLANKIKYLIANQMIFFNVCVVLYNC